MADDGREAHVQCGESSVNLPSVGLPGASFIRSPGNGYAAQALRIFFGPVLLPKAMYQDD